MSSSASNRTGFSRCFLAETVVSWETKRMTHGEGGCVMIGQIADQLINQTAKVR